MGVSLFGFSTHPNDFVFDPSKAVSDRGGGGIIRLLNSLWI